MTTDTGTLGATGSETARLFIEALNARDAEALRAAVTDDVQFRTREGRSLSGPEAVDLLVTAAEETGLIIARSGQPELDERAARVTIPVRVVLGSGDSMRGTAVFELRDGKVAAFEVHTDT